MPYRFSLILLPKQKLGDLLDTHGLDFEVLIGNEQAGKPGQDQVLVHLLPHQAILLFRQSAQILVQMIYQFLLLIILLLLIFDAVKLFQLFSPQSFCGFVIDVGPGFVFDVPVEEGHGLENL